MISTAANLKEPTQRGLPSQEEEIIGYVDPWIASPGENVHVKVSPTRPHGGKMKGNPVLKTPGLEYSPGIHVVVGANHPRL